MPKSYNPEEKESGPVVVHVKSPHQTLLRENNMSNLVRSTPRRGQKFLIIIGCLLGFASIKIFLENDLTENMSPDIPIQKKRQRTNTESSKAESEFPIFDVNAPPPEQRRSGSVADSLLASWSQRSRRKEKKKVFKKKKLNKATRDTVVTKTSAYNLAEMNDDNIPQAAAGAIQTAAEAILCPDSVTAFVENATDLKDECDGLKKAFSKHCADSDEPAIQGNRRRLSEIDEIISINSERKNPLIDWQSYLRGAIQQTWFHKSPSFYHRRLGETMEYGKSEKNKLNKESTNGIRFLNEKNEEKEVKKSPSLKDRTRISRRSMDLPIKGHHLSQKALTETLMLQQDEKSVIASIQAAQNMNATNTPAAKESAAASLKAVADTTELVSSVLNDPSSVEARTCCASMLNVFHETCSVDEEEELSDKQLFLGVAVIAVCGLVKSLIRHFQIRWLPEAGGCVLVGVAAGWFLHFFPHHEFSFDGNWFLRIMVPPIIFEASLSIDKRSFNRYVVPIILFASVGTLFATIMTAFFVHKVSSYFECTTIPITEAMTFGALISSIDPIAVLSVLSNMGMMDTDTIYVLIFGESLLNDGVAIVLFETLLHFLDDNMQGDTYAVMAAGVHFMVVATGSLLIGVGSGLCCTLYYWLMHGCQTPLVEILMFCCWALLPYYVCDGIEWSGIVAVVAAGFIMDMYVVGQNNVVGEKDEDVPRKRRIRAIFSKEGHLSSEAKMHIGFVTEIIATTMETAIFAYLGLFLFSSRYHWNFTHAIIAIVGCLLSRAIMIPSLTVIANWITRSQQVRADCLGQQLPVADFAESKQPNAAGVVIDKKIQLVLWFAGLRGAMSFALVENIPLYDPVAGEGTGLKSELKAMTSACILFTVFVLGGCTYYMMESLGLAPSSSGDGSGVYAEERFGLLLKQNNEEELELYTSESMDYVESKKSTPPRTKFRQRIGH